jgi:hypothetical protein
MRDARRRMHFSRSKLHFSPCKHGESGKAAQKSPNPIFEKGIPIHANLAFLAAKSEPKNLRAIAEIRLCDLPPPPSEYPLGH